MTNQKNEYEPVMTKLCDPHYEALKLALIERGMEDFIPATNDETAARMRDFQRGNEKAYDPMLDSVMMIVDEIVSRCGIEGILPKPDGHVRCPLCTAAEHGSPQSQWLDAVSTQAHARCRKYGLIHLVS